jgi:hypothetical protein
MSLNKKEYKAFDELTPYPGHRLAQAYADQMTTFEKALAFAAKHGYVPPRDRCPIHVNVDQLRINAIMCTPNLDPFRLAQCELDVGHEGHCRVTP